MYRAPTKEKEGSRRDAGGTTWSALKRAYVLETGREIPSHRACDVEAVLVPQASLELTKRDFIARITRDGEEVFLRKATRLQEQT